MSVTPTPPPSLWARDNTSVDDFDPFDANLPGTSVSERLRYLFLRVVLQNDRREWRAPDCPQFRIFALRSLYAAIIGFNKDNLSLLYPNGLSRSDTGLWLTKAQQTTGSPSIRDRCCGHVFEKGETYYRCKFIPFHLKCLWKTMLCGFNGRHLFTMFQHSRSQFTFRHHAGGKRLWWLL